MLRWAAGMFVTALAAGCAHAPPSPGLARVAAWVAPVEIAPGERARVVLEIRPEPGVHLSEEAPLSVEIEAHNLALDKRALTRADAVPADGAVRLEVGARAGRSGPAAIEARLVYYVCTVERCARQTATARVAAVVR